MTEFIERFIVAPTNLPSSPLLRNHCIIDELDDAGNHDYRFESVRLATFKDWPCAWMKPERLAAAGFYYTGESDKVKCFECLVEICQWQPDDNPMVDHQRWSGKCRFIRNLPCGNVPIGADPNTIPAPSPKGKDVCGPYGMVYMPLSGPDHNLEDQLLEDTIKFNLNANNCINSARPKYSEFASYDARLRTFHNWPISMAQKKEDLASAGFYYTGSSDQTLCYHCGGGLKNWEIQDDPWQQHARWFDTCPYLLMVKGSDFVSRVTGRTYHKDSLESYHSSIAESSGAEISDEQSSVSSAGSGDSGVEAECGSLDEISLEEEQTIAKFSKLSDKDARMCKICYSRELRMVFIPCGHLLTCAECAKNMQICGVCRKPVKITVQAYIP